MGGVGALMRHGELLQEQLVDSVLELGEGVAAANVVASIAEALVEPSEKVEGQCAIRDGFPKIRKLLRHVLEAPAKVHDGKITLDEVAELDVEVEGACLPVAKELVLEGAPDSAGCGGAIDHHLGEVGGDRPCDPGLDHAIQQVQSGNPGAVRSARTWDSREYLPMTRRI